MSYSNSNLNPEQKRAVETTDGPVLIVAGAGSGKTRVIAHRILNLIRKGAAPRSILAITFTNKAARGMRERVDGLLSGDNAVNRPVSSQDRPFISTFHALGVYIIRENAHLLGLNRHFKIYDRGDSRRAVKEAMNEIGIDPKAHDPNSFLERISRAKSDGLNAIGFRDAADGFTAETTADIWEKYDAILAKEKALDFDDLLVKSVGLLERKEIRERYNSVWKYIHIDEYQDTNRIQYKMTELLTGPDDNICVVGDPDQNIYSWRGATIENILRFEKDHRDAAVITLESNYRSTKNILDAANSVIEKNTGRKKKILRTDNPEGEKLVVTACYTETDEARAVADTARDLIDSGIQPKEIAVLYRANFQSRAIEDAFIKKNLPYQLLGIRFFERKEVKDVLAYIRAALDSNTGTVNAADVARVINVPPRGIGKVTLAKVLAGQEDSLPQTMKAKLSDFHKLLGDIKKALAEKKPSEAVRFVIQGTGMERAFQKGDSEDEERLLNVRELVSVAAQYDASENGIEAFLENAALATDQDELKEDKDAVRLMTVHASKGLEFDHVFIVGLEQDLFPFKHMDESGVSRDEEEEERRLFYVALTRARKKVHLSHALLRTVYGSQRVSSPSEFLGDIDEKLIENSAPEEPTGAKAIFIDF